MRISAYIIDIVNVLIPSTVWDGVRDSAWSHVSNWGIVDEEIEAHFFSARLQTNSIPFWNSVSVAASSPVSSSAKPISAGTTR